MLVGTLQNLGKVAFDDDIWLPFLLGIINGYIYRIGKINQFLDSYYNEDINKGAALRKLLFKHHSSESAVKLFCFDI
jgi:hypothetical protein